MALRLPAAKGGNLLQLPRRTQALHGLLDAVCGLQRAPVPAN
ncbi:MAG: hypothetical protein NTV86_09850 [Planctomycetota bacterium]|nr:hypothetical protein [Planctomycetota bacterium]